MRKKIKKKKLKYKYLQISLFYFKSKNVLMFYFECLKYADNYIILH